jgi:hypothetical protein
LSNDPSDFCFGKLAPIHSLLCSRSTDSAFPEELNRYALLIGSCYLLSAWCLAKSWAQRWRVSTQPRVALLIAIVTLAALYQFSQVEPNVWARVSSFSVGSSLVLLLPILQVHSKKNSYDWLDKSLLWLSIIFTAYTFTRPALIWLLGYTDLRALPRSPYWILTLLSILNFSLLFTVVMSAIAVRKQSASCARNETLML